MDDNRLAKIAKNGKHSQVSKMLVRKSDINITGEQAHWIKSMSCILSYEKRKKERRTT